jgi:hypothetical protein
MAVQVDAIVLFHALHKLLHENPISYYKLLPLKNKIGVTWARTDDGCLLALGKMIQWKRPSVGSFTAFGSMPHRSSTHDRGFGDLQCLFSEMMRVFCAQHANSMRHALET